MVHILQALIFILTCPEIFKSIQLVNYSNRISLFNADIVAQVFDITLDVAIAVANPVFQNITW